MTETGLVSDIAMAAADMAWERLSGLLGDDLGDCWCSVWDELSFTTPQEMCDFVVSACGLEKATPYIVPPEALYRFLCEHQEFEDVKGYDGLPTVQKKCFEVYMAVIVALYDRVSPVAPHFSGGAGGGFQKIDETPATPGIMDKL